MAPVLIQFPPYLLATSCLLLLIAALHDIAARTIPDLICLALAFLGVARHLPDGRLPIALLASFLILLLAVPLWWRGLTGGGDVKLLTAVALLVPPGRVTDLLLVMALVGGALALLYLTLAPLLPEPAAARPAATTARILRIEQWRIRRRGPLPYGVAIAAGAITVLLGGHPL
jgi:prepilin peptidase CpaA